MSTETPGTVPNASSEHTSLQLQPTPAVEHSAKSQASVQALGAVPAAESHACCHGSSAAGSVSKTALIKGTGGSGAQSAAFSCTEHRPTAVLQALVTSLDSSDTATRAAAAIAMGKSADGAAAAPLIRALRDVDADVAREAAAALGVLGDASAVEPLIAVLENAEGYFHPVVRAAATFSLGQLHDLRAFEPLVRAINDPIAEASAEAMRSLATLADRRAVAPLLAVIRNESAYFLPAARRAAILALAKLGGEQAECELRFVAGNQWEDAVIRNAAVVATAMRSPATGGH